MDHKQGRSHTFTLGFTSDAGRELTLVAAATPLFFAENRDKVAITYLEENRRNPRAIRFQALTGPRKALGAVLLSGLLVSNAARVLLGS